MMPSPRRHALVVASQCEHAGELPELGLIAESLRDIFLDPDVGCCAAALPDGAALLAGRLSFTEIIEKIDEAIGYAAHNGATLLLAFLGHGFIPGTHPTLYFMGWNSVEGDGNSGVNITDVLTRAANTPGIRGVAAVIDTCTAAAAIPEIGALTGGALTGQTRLSLVMASAVGRSAFDMGLSRELVRLLRSGVPDTGPHLWLSAPEIKSVLRAALPGQPPVFHDYDGAATQPGELWLARNAQAEPAMLGSYGLAELTEALAPLLPAMEPREPWPRGSAPDAGELRELRRRLAALPVSPARIRAERLLDSLHAAQETVAFLRSLRLERLTESALRCALIAAGGSGGPPAGPARIAQVASEVDAVEYAAVSYPRAERSCRPQLTRFVVELADDVGLDLDAPALREWAAGIDAIVPFNEAVAVRRQWRSERRLRLIVSLHYAPAGDWPDKLGVWLLYDGQFYQRRDIGCPPDQPGAEGALAEAVDWAEERAEELDVPLRRVEVAVPVSILLRWRPEEVRHLRRLGMDYEVLTRWSQRLDRGAAMRRINRNARRRLAEIAENSDDEPLQWLHAHQVTDLAALLEEFVNGRYSRAIGLVDDPGENERLFEVLLEFAPILIWPQAGQLGKEHQDTVSTRWGELPAAFTAAYRALHGERDGGPLADLRAIWDDEEWLSFCGDLRVQPGGTEE
jgi:vWA-MoxR associated protein middle region (VMAP-M) 2